MRMARDCSSKAVARGWWLVASKFVEAMNGELAGWLDSGLFLGLNPPHPWFLDNDETTGVR